jgi:hypothetical protein
VNNKTHQTSRNSPSVKPPQQYESANRFNVLQHEVFAETHQEPTPASRPQTRPMTRPKQRPEPRFKFVEMKHGVDLFAAPEHFSLAHCVDKTFAMRRGIAKEFAQKFRRREELKNMNKNVGQVATLKDRKRHIFYLITKACHDNIPRLNTS